jgi:hypothetical protein
MFSGRNSNKVSVLEAKSLMSPTLMVSCDFCVVTCAFLKQASKQEEEDPEEDRLCQYLSAKVYFRMMNYWYESYLVLRCCSYP